MGSRRSALLVLLAAVCALSFAYGPNWQDVSRLGLAQAVVHDGTIRIDRYAAETGDKALYGGHVYSDKAPAMSFLAVPTVAVVAHGGQSIWHSTARLQVARALTGGLAFVLALVLVRLGAKRLRRGTGDAVAISFALGTLALPLAATVLGHLAAGVFALTAFLLVATRSRLSNRLLLGAGCCAGTAVLFEYQAALAAAVVLVYVAARSRSARGTALFLLGALPPALVLGVYDWAAFGSPLRLSYRYVDPNFLPAQRSGFFGIHAPRLDGLRDVFVGRHGVLLEEPLLVVAAAGLVLLWRRGLRAEALVCGTIGALFALLDAGYYDPYGGESPGPRFLVPAIPFVVLGLGETYVRWPRLTALVTVYSAAAMLLDAGLYGPNYDFATIWSVAGAPRPAGIAIVVVAAAAALTLALRPALRRTAEATPPPPSPRSPGP